MRYSKRGDESETADEDEIGMGMAFPEEDAMPDVWPVLNQATACNDDFGSDEDEPELMQGMSGTEGLGA